MDYVPKRGHHDLCFSSTSTLVNWMLVQCKMFVTTLFSFTFLAKLIDKRPNQVVSAAKLLISSSDQRSRPWKGLITASGQRGHPGDTCQVLQKGIPFSWCRQTLVHKQKKQKTCMHLICSLLPEVHFTRILSLHLQLCHNQRQTLRWTHRWGDMIGGRWHISQT